MECARLKTVFGIYETDRRIGQLLLVTSET